MNLSWDYCHTSRHFYAKKMRQNKTSPLDPSANLVALDVPG